MQIIKRQTLVFKLIVNLRLDRKRRVHKCGLKAKNKMSLWTYLIKEQSVGEVQRQPSCSITCCLKCSCLQRSLCNCSLQFCRYCCTTDSFQTKQLAIYFKFNLVHMFTKTKSRAALELTDCCTSAFLSYESYETHLFLPICYFMLSVLGEIYNFLLKGRVNPEILIMLSFTF